MLACKRVPCRVAGIDATRTHLVVAYIAKETLVLAPTECLAESELCP